MVVFYNAYGMREGTCMSGDTKPTVEHGGFPITDGSILYEKDTQKLFMYDIATQKAGNDPWIPQN